MRWIELMVLSAALGIIYAEPEPKKYKPDVKTKDIETNTSLLSDEERKFLREVEAKFGIKSEVPLDDNEEDIETLKQLTDPKSSESSSVKPAFPAVIAIEIVNDTDTKTKGKRTIDANLGYGYRTNNGYTYTYFGKSNQDKGKFMIYPYSQEDIPPANPNNYAGYSHQGQQGTKISADVEILPSQAYELVPEKEERPAYHYDKPAVQLTTKYEDAHGVQAPPPPYPVPETPVQTPPATNTLYTTYNGKEFSGLSGQFPQVMPNYLVDPSQLVNNPQYQSVGVTQEHFRSHGGKPEQRVVPVLVLRVPSSYIRNPSAELYANVPQNYPLSQYLNHLNLQQLVNEYFRKIGYTHAPQVMTYNNAPAPIAVPETHIPKPVAHYERQQYASPYVQPSYTHADYSGVQYSAVQPVMAKYPASYSRQPYYVVHGQSLYQQQPRQKYLYMYQYVPQSAVHHQNYYVQPQYHRQESYRTVAQAPQYQHHETYQTVTQAPQYQHQETYQTESHTPQYQQQDSYQTVAHEPQQQHAVQEITIHESPQNTIYEHQPEESEGTDQHEGGHLTSIQIEHPNPQDTQQYEQSPTAAAEHEHESTAVEYEHPQTATPATEYGPTQAPVHTQSVQVQYEQSPAQKETIAIFHRSQTGHNYNVNSVPSTQQTYSYENAREHSSGDNLVLTENYPSKDHTIATVLPLSYKSRQQQNEPVQSVSYVTPIPTMKYHSRYRVMVPQTILKHPSSEKIAYVNSHSLPQATSTRDYNPEEEYTAGPHYVPPISKQKPSVYPKNYHAHPKRMTRTESKSDTSSSLSRKIDRNNKKKSS